MNNIEFKLLREELHLSQTEIAEVLKVSLRTVQYWEQGKFKMPVSVQEELGQFYKDVQAGINHFIDLMIEKKVTHDYIIALLSYGQSTYDGDFPHYKLHNACITKCKLKADELGYKVRLVFFDYEKYHQWLGDKEDTQANRSTWASLQVVEENKKC